MKYRYHFLFVLVILLIFSTEIFAQEESTVTGIVTDSETTEPLPGVNIAVKGTTTGTSTDSDGNYSLTVPTLNDTLVFSFIGYKTEEIPINGRTGINIKLQGQAVAGEELVVVGYGSQNKKEVTGAISSVDMEKVGQNLPNISLTQSLDGVAGVQFKNDGRPGQGGELLIRGQSSLSGGNEPLIVLDGIIFRGSLSDINPQDIASMDILKDASSTAIYGSKAANGVILVTTKKGTSQEPTVSLNVFNGISQPANQLKLLSADRYIERRIDWRRQSGLDANPNNIADYLSPTEAQNYNNGVSRDPWNVISQQGRISSLDASIAGRTDRVNYYFSTSYNQDRGLIKNDNLDRINLRSNLDFIISDWLTIGTNTTYSQRDLSGVEANVNDAYRNSPFGTWYYPDGAPTEHPVASEQASDNPMWESVLIRNDEVYNNLFSNIYAELFAPVLDGQLSYRVNYSPNLRWNHNYNYMRQDQYISYNNTYANKYNENSFDWVLENILTYDKRIGQNHDFDITLLYSRTHSEMESSMANADLLSLDGLGYDNLELGTVLSNTSYAQNVEGISYMGRLNYQFKGRYLFTATVRRDGSSVFSENNKYATFPSAAVAWIASDEPFIRDMESLGLLKIRLSYGAVGNQAIEPYQSLSLSETERYVFGNGAESQIGVVTSTLGNSNLKWETTYTANAAVDFELFNGWLGGTVELYNSNTQDLLVRRSIPVMNGYSSVLTNIGEVRNRGVEVLLNTINIQQNKFSWNSSFTFAYNQNKIMHLFGTDLDNDGREDDNISNSWFIGHPIDSYYDYDFDGIYQVGDDDIPAGSEPGFVRVKDLNGDGIINSEDRKVVASGGSPKYQLSFTNRFSYGNFDLSILMNAMLGWEAPFNLINPLVPGRAFNQLDAGWWTEENQSNSRPSLVYSNPLGTNWYMSRDFVRLKNISLSYTFGEDLINKIGVSNMRVFC